MYNLLISDPSISDVNDQQKKLCIINAPEIVLTLKVHLVAGKGFQKAEAPKETLFWQELHIQRMYYILFLPTVNNKNLFSMCNSPGD